jgi:dTDP-4-amino-4,6-dideoxygalactose transaminase
MACILCDLGPGDEVILPSFTFTSTANAVVRLGAKPVFAEIRPDTLNIDETKMERLITSRTRAIIPVHYAGVPCEMDAILAIAESYGLRVIEDAAQGVGGWYKGRALGTIGHLGAFSFHSTKDYTCGEGGALCVNDPALVERAEIIREKGTNRSRFLRGEVQKYAWVDVGSSYLPSELACAFLCAQLESMDSIRAARRAAYERYIEDLTPLEEKGVLRLPKVPESCEPSYHLFYVLCPDTQTRDNLLEHCHKQRIGATFHYVPLHSSPMGMRYGYGEGDLPITEQSSSRLLRLPFYAGLTEGDQAAVVRCVEDFFIRSKTARTRTGPSAQVPE